MLELEFAHLLTNDPEVAAIAILDDQFSQYPGVPATLEIFFP
jgi:hypothetical protein